MGLSQLSLLFDGHLRIYAILKQIQIPELTLCYVVLCCVV